MPSLLASIQSMFFFGVFITNVAFFSIPPSLRAFVQLKLLFVQYPFALEHGAAIPLDTLAARTPAQKVRFPFPVPEQMLSQEIAHFCVT